MEVVKKERVLVLAAAMVGGAILGYFYFQKKKAKDPREELSQQESHLLGESNLTSAQASNLYQSAAKQREAGFLDKNFLLNIIRVTIDSIRREAVAVYTETNKQKRKDFENVERWCVLQERCQSRLDAMFKRAFSGLCRELAIDTQTVEQKIEVYSASDPQFALMVQCVVENLKAEVKSGRKAPPTKEELMRFLDHQLDVYRSTRLEAFSSTELGERLEQKVFFTAEKACWLCGLEEGDLVMNTSILADAELISKQKELKRLIETEEVSASSRL